MELIQADHDNSHQRLGSRIDSFLRKTILMFFTGLEEIRLAAYEYDPEKWRTQPLSLQHLKERRDILLRLFETRNREDVTVKIPKITFHIWIADYVYITDAEKIQNPVLFAGLPIQNVKLKGIEAGS
ncbi:hypothetical protein G7Y89_g13324 [Cudoniella acicularis]|uniref:Uncharacterized protein n=1 Tax=Cudoniella acicularis TaxID=354080 RepID=A0A8H4R7I0_9HELO|nr:hypothetical protein G7Y89_g13324 [Cudoniella acicularis]